MTDIIELAQRMKAAAEKVTALNLDTAQEVRDEDGYLECPVCGGEGSVDAERDYCNIDGVALGIQFYGIGEHHGLAEQYFRIATPSNILDLVEALEKAQAKIIELQQGYEIDPRTHEIIDLQERIAELESRTVNVKLPTTIEPTAFSPWAAKAFYQFHKDTVKSCFAVFSDACAAAGINLEAE